MDENGYISDVFDLERLTNIWDSLEEELKEPFLAWIGCADRGLIKMDIDFQPCSNKECSSCRSFESALNKVAKEL